MIKRLAPWVFLLLLLCLPRSALSQTASITGTVKDSTGAAVPQAKVTTHNRATSATRSTTTDDSGIYRITSLSPGNYDVVIEKAGFKIVEYSLVALTVDHVQNLDATLAPSSVTEKVTVTGESVAPVDLNDAQIGNIVTSEQINNWRYFRRARMRAIRF